jgi:hypothetical protein
MYERYLWIGLILLIAIAIIEIWKPKWINEGFSNLITVGDSLMWAQWVPRRGDVGFDPTEEQGGYIRDMRYFAGYTDVQRLGQDHDFCRMVQSSGDDKDKFFACALGGTEGLSSIVFRTSAVKDGFQLSRDDYMNDVLKDGRQGYCRILKMDGDTFEAKCNPADDHGFKERMITDSNPPPPIKILLTFYEGIVFWLRFRDDMLDYAKNLIITKAGDMEIEEEPNPETTQGLEFNGEDQFLRIGDTANLSFGDIVQLKYLRATSFWVYFEEFTNNAKIFDFGNGAGKDNVFVGIIGRGNAGVQQQVTSAACPEDQSKNTVPDAPSGAQCTEVVSPQTAMATSSANVNLWDCPKPELFGRIMPPLDKKAEAAGEAKTADLLYEIWDSQQRKLHIQVKNVIPLRKWVHIVITAEGGDPWKPALKIYADGMVVHQEDSAWLPQTNYTSNNYIGKSNWMDRTSGMANRDELFKGKLFDFRGYRSEMNQKRVKNTHIWGKKMLGIKDGEEEDAEEDEN